MVLPQMIAKGGRRRQGQCDAAMGIIVPAREAARMTKTAAMWIGRVHSTGVKVHPDPLAAVGELMSLIRGESV
jgi:hypothetical protein